MTGLVPTRALLLGLLALMTLMTLTTVDCGPHPAPSVASTPLGGDAAHVGNVAIPAALVVGVARSRGVESRRALDGLVEDALLAQEAHARGLDLDGPVRWACTSALARAVSERLMDGARQRGAPTDEELATLRVIHAVVLSSSALSPSRATEIALDIRQAVANARSEDEFETQARKVPHSDAKVRVERLDPFDASGRTAEGVVFDPSFVAGAFELHARGQTSGVVPSLFGWHVIRLIERVPPGAATLEKQREELAGDVLQMRVRVNLRDLLEARRQRAKPEVSPAADDLMAIAAMEP